MHNREELLIRLLECKSYAIASIDKADQAASLLSFIETIKDLKHSPFDDASAATVSAQGTLMKNGQYNML